MTEGKTIADFRADLDGHRQELDTLGEYGHRVPMVCDHLVTMVEQLLDEIVQDRAALVEVRRAWGDFADQPSECVALIGETLVQHHAGELEAALLERVEKQRDEHRDDVLKLEARIEAALEVLGITHYDELVPAIERLRDVPGAGASPIPEANLPRVVFPASQHQHDSLELDVRRLSARVHHLEQWAVTEHSRTRGDRAAELLPRPALVLPEPKQTDDDVIEMRNGAPVRVHTYDNEDGGRTHRVESDE